MNLRPIARNVGLLQLIIAASMAGPLIWSLLHGDGDAGVFALSIVIAAAVGAGLWLIGRTAPPELFRREALATVSLGWALAAVLGSIPFILADVLGPVDALFESMSGLTTTGATVIRDIDGLLDSTKPTEEIHHGIVYWRAMTHWLGGMGIIVLLVALLPSAGVGAKMLYQSEVQGPPGEGLRPRIRQTATRLLMIYVALTAVLCLLLWWSGMTMYEAQCHAFACISTGGFSTRNASVGGFDSLQIEMIIIVFMILSGTNFLLHHRALLGKVFAPFRDPEWLVFISALALGIGLVSWDVFTNMERPPENFSTALRWSSFSVTSILTCTGYGTEDFNLWPPMSRALLVGMMFMGGCAGSTSGGLKVVRVIILGKILHRHVRHMFQPRRVQALHVGQAALNEEDQRGVLIFFIAFVAVYVAGVLLMTMLGLDLVTAASSVIACMSNVGPGLGMIGPATTYADVPETGKLILAGLMLVGRIEIWGALCLLLPSFWRAV